MHGMTCCWRTNEFSAESTKKDVTTKARTESWCSAASDSRKRLGVKDSSGRLTSPTTNPARAVGGSRARTQTNIGAIPRSQ